MEKKRETGRNEKQTEKNIEKHLQKKIEKRVCKRKGGCFGKGEKINKVMVGFEYFIEKEQSYSVQNQ